MEHLVLEFDSNPFEVLGRVKLAMVSLGQFPHSD